MHINESGDARLVIFLDNHNRRTTLSSILDSRLHTLKGICDGNDRRR
jgi:hypothetical protein